MAGYKYQIQFLELEDAAPFNFQGSAILGSQSGDVVVNIEGVDPRHCKLIARQGTVSIQDEGSESGVYVNGQQLSPGKKVMVKPTDDIKIGPHPVKIHIISPADQKDELKISKGPDSSLVQTVDNEIVDGMEFDDLDAMGKVDLESDTDREQRVQKEESQADIERKKEEIRKKRNEQKQKKLMEELRKKQEESNQELAEEEAPEKNEKLLATQRASEEESLSLWQWIWAFIKGDLGNTQAEDNIDEEEDNDNDEDEDEEEEGKLSNISEVDEDEEDEEEEESLSLWQKILVFLGFRVVNEEEEDEEDEEDEDEIEGQISELSEIDEDEESLSLWQKIKRALGLYSPEEDDEHDDELDDDEETDLDAPPPLPGGVVGTYREIDDEGQEEAKKVKAIKIKKREFTAAGTFVRTLSIIGDAMITFALWIILSPYDAFTNLILEYRPRFIEWFMPHITDLLGMIEGDYSEQILKAIKSDYFILLMMYMLFRATTSVILGVSFSQWFFGIRTNRKKIIIRQVSSLLRSFFGLITAPFLIFDIPALFSRKTLKEVLSFSKLLKPKALSASLGLFLYFPVLLVIILMAPLFKGLELREPYTLSAKVSLTASRFESGDPYLTAQWSDYFLLKSTAQGDSLLMVPMVNITKSWGVNHYDTHLLFFEKETEHTWQLEKVEQRKSVDIIKKALRFNFLAEKKFPALLSFSQDVAHTNKAFRESQLGPRQKELFEEELMQLTRDALGLTAKNFHQYAKSKGPFINGLVDYRSDLFSESLLKKAQNLRFERLGQALVLSFVYSDKQTPVYRFITLTPQYVNTYDVHLLQGGEQALKSVKKLFSEFQWYRKASNASLGVGQDNSYGALMVIDLINQNKKAEVGELMAQKVFAYYYEKALQVLEQNDEAQGLWLLRSLDSTLRYLRSLQKAAESLDEANPHNKLITILIDLKVALEEKDLRYFKDS